MEHARSRYGLGAWHALLVAAGLQTFIDRRFYRRKYDAEQVLTTFASTLRDEVDLDRLSSALVTVVEETMQPAHVSLWFREAPDRDQDHMGPK